MGLFVHRGLDCLSCVPGQAYQGRANRQEGAVWQRERSARGAELHACRLTSWPGSRRAAPDLALRAAPDLALLHPQVELRAEDRFFVLACDGVWDVMSNQEVVQFVSVCLDSGMALPDIASQLLDACLAPDPRETRGIGARTHTCMHVCVCALLYQCWRRGWRACVDCTMASSTGNQAAHGLRCGACVHVCIASW